MTGIPYNNLIDPGYDCLFQRSLWWSRNIKWEPVYLTKSTKFRGAGKGWVHTIIPEKPFLKLFLVHRKGVYLLPCPPIFDLPDSNAHTLKDSLSPSLATNPHWESFLIRKVYLDWLAGCKGCDRPWLVVCAMSACDTEKSLTCYGKGGRLALCTMFHAVTKTAFDFPNTDVWKLVHVLVHII